MNTVQISDVLHDEPLHWEDWDLLSGASVDFLALLPVLEPCLCGKVDGFTNVEASRESGMIGTRQSQDVLSWVLERLVNRDLQLKELGEGRDALTPCCLR